MEILNIATTILWIGVALRCTSIFITLVKMKHEDHELITFALNIILLAGLNICIGFYTIVDVPMPFSDCTVMQRFYFGSSLFQLLLAYCVIERIKRVGLKPKQK